MRTAFKRKQMKCHRNPGSRALNPSGAAFHLVSKFTCIQMSLQKWIASSSKVGATASTPKTHRALAGQAKGVTDSRSYSTASCCHRKQGGLDQSFQRGSRRQAISPSRPQHMSPCSPQSASPSRGLQPLQQPQEPQPHSLTALTLLGKRDTDPQ